jgi:hypothetical protein
MTPHHGVPLTDPLTSKQSRTWDPEFDDPTYRALVAELGPPGLLVGPARTIAGEVIPS